MRALITGVTGQDGSYLAELLLEKGYEVYGIVRNVARRNAKAQAASAAGSIMLRPILLTKLHLIAPWNKLRPDEVYNLAGQTFVPVSWNQPF